MLQLRTRTVHRDGTRGVRATGRVESFYEKSGLDEIAQVANVLRGEMSLFGPRPLRARAVSRLTLDQRRTLGARPGMAGPWQVTWPTGASETDMRAVEADYLRRWRVTHDVELLLTTPFAIVKRRLALGETEIARRRGDPGGLELHVPPEA
jgi:lipopolysaccharide/colanic/teichoic acid biosynthesis glycosyltransferase